MRSISSIRKYDRTITMKTLLILITSAGLALAEDKPVHEVCLAEKEAMQAEIAELKERVKQLGALYNSAIGAMLSEAAKLEQAKIQAQIKVQQAKSKPANGAQ